MYRFNHKRPMVCRCVLEGKTDRGIYLSHPENCFGSLRLETNDNFDDKSMIYCHSVIYENGHCAYQTG